MDLLCCGRRTWPTSSSSSSSVVLDLQCFTDNHNEFIVKEACVLDVSRGTILLHHIAEPPFDQDRYLTREKQRERYWLTNHYHGLEWNSGDIPYNQIMNKLIECLSQHSVIYVKGIEKKMFVLKCLTGSDEVDTKTTSTETIYSSSTTPRVIDMNDIGCNSIDSIGRTSLSKVRCNHHKSTRHCCALSNCILLRNWLLVTANETEER